MFDVAPILSDSEDKLHIEVCNKKLFLDSNKVIKVFVRFIVSKRGLPGCMEIIRSPNDSLNNLAIKAIRKIRFKPASKKGQALDAVMVLPITFSYKVAILDKRCNKYQ